MIPVYEHQFFLVLMIFARTSVILVAGPFFMIKGIPAFVRISLAFLIALVILTNVENRALTYEVTMEFLIFSIIQEVLIGFVIAIASNYLFAGVQMAGHIIGLDMGFAMATFFDSSSNANLPVLSMMMYYMTFLIYILINGHHYLLGAIFYSYEVIPFDAWQMTGKTAQNMISLVGDVFMISLQVAAPVFITLFVTSISLAFISKIVPQLNIFVVAFQLKILIGLMMLLTVFPIIISIFRNIFMNFERNVIRLIETMIVG